MKHTLILAGWLERRSLHHIHVTGCLLRVVHLAFEGREARRRRIRGVAFNRLPVVTLQVALLVIITHGGCARIVSQFCCTRRRLGARARNSFTKCLALCPSVLWDRTRYLQVMYRNLWVAWNRKCEDNWDFPSISLNLSFRTHFSLYCRADCYYSQHGNCFRI